MKVASIIIFALNVFAYSPILSHWEIGGIAIRVVQAVTIAFGLLNLNYRDPALKKVGILLLLIFLLNTVSEFFHREAVPEAILKLLIHCVYIISLFGLMPNISKGVFRNGFLFLLLTNLGWFFLYIRNYNPDFSLLKSGSIEGVVSIKSAKGDIIESGFSLVSIHIFPLLLFILIPYLSKKANMIFAFAVSICLLFSLTFTAILASVLTVVAFFLMKWTRHCSNYVFKVFFIGYAVLMVFLYLNDFFDLRTLTTGRSVLWQVAIENIKNNPIFGVSLSDFYIMAIHWNAPEISGGSCHNMYLSWFMNHGVISFCVYLNLIAFYWNQIVKRRLILLLPFLYILIRGTHEATGFIDFSDGVIEYLVDMYIVFTISKSRIYGENCCGCSVAHNSGNMVCYGKAY